MVPDQTGLVTPPLPEDIGFSGRCGGLKGKPCPEYVSGRVHVRVREVPATLMDVVLSRSLTSAPWAG